MTFTVLGVMTPSKRKIECPQVDPVIRVRNLARREPRSYLLPYSSNRAPQGAGANVASPHSLGPGESKTMGRAALPPGGSVPNSSMRTLAWRMPRACFCPARITAPVGRVCHGREKQHQDGRHSRPGNPLWLLLLPLPSQRKAHAPRQGRSVLFLPSALKLLRSTSAPSANPGNLAAPRVFSLRRSTRSHSP